MGLRPNRIKPEAIAAGAAASAVFLLMVWWSGSGTLCVVRTWTGLPCPGCGLTSAFLALLRGDAAASLAYHPLLIPALAALLLAATPLRGNFKWFYLALTALFLALFAVRMALYFPRGPYPMVYEPANLLRKLYMMISGR